MELKLGISVTSMFRASLLIVPYGIETNIHIFNCYFYYNLLIVPYGIETDIL